MSRLLLLTNPTIVNQGTIKKGHILIKDTFFDTIYYHDPPQEILNNPSIQKIDLTGKYVLPGMIDDQVHFREPGLVQKADISTESKAAIAGGITSFMEMPNTQPPTLNQQLLEDKFRIASEKSYANYSFYMGTSNENIKEVLGTDKNHVCGIKIFMGSSTGNMLVEDNQVLKKIFKEAKMLVAVHCEDESTIKHNLEKYKQKYASQLPVRYHSKIRSREACYISSSKAVALAKKFETRLHVLHISTIEELNLFSSNQLVKNKKITAEACIHHLWFSQKDYLEKGMLIKWNPSIKEETDRIALIDAVNNGLVDIIATDHAPHTLAEKKQNYFNSPSGGPLVQHALVALLELYKQDKIQLTTIVQKTAHNPATCFGIKKRGFIKPNYYADFVVVDMDCNWKARGVDTFYKCKWTPFEGQTFTSKVIKTFVNGQLVFDNGNCYRTNQIMPLEFSR